MLFYRTVYIVLFLFMNKILIPKNYGAFIYSANIAITHYIYKTKNGNNSTCWPGFFKGIFCILIFCITSLWWYLTHVQHQGTTNCKRLKVYLFILSHSSNFIRNVLFFSHDVTAAMLVSQNNETAAMLLSQTSPVGDKLFPHALMRFLLFQQTCIYVGHVSENTLLMSVIVSQSIVFYKNRHLYRIYIYIDIYSLLDI